MSICVYAWRGWMGLNHTHTTHSTEQQKIQETVVALLEHISQGLDVETSLPSEQRFKVRMFIYIYMYA